MKYWTLCVIAVLCYVGTLSAQQATLSDQDIEKAIGEGLNGKGKEQGLELSDTARKWMSTMGAAVSGSKGHEIKTSEGYRLEVYTPLTWIKQLASEAGKEYRTFTIKDVTEDMRKPVLRVTVYPASPEVVTAEGMASTSSVQHVVIRDDAKKTAIQPIQKEPFTEEAANAVGGKAVFQGLRVQFSLEDLRKVRGPNGTDEFNITVVGNNYEKDFKIKEKNFKRIP